MFVRQKSHKMKQSQAIWVLGHHITPYKTAGNYNLVIGETPAGAQGPPPHSHSRYDEVFLIIEGEAEFVIDGQARTFRAGECADLPRGAIHTFNNVSDQPCRWVNIHSPKGFQGFFDTFGVPETEADAIAKSLDPERIGQVVARAAEFDMALQPLPEAARPE